MDDSNPLLTAPIRVVIVDDHPAIRHFLVAITRTVGGMVVVGEAESGGEAVGVVAARHPDVLVLDDHLPDQSGLSVAQHVRANDPDVRILVYTGVPDVPGARGLLALGVDGYLRKTASVTETITAIRAVATGQRVIDPGLAKELAGVHGVTLTPREIEALRLVVSGLSNSAIALALGRSDKTIEAHLGHLHDKLGVHARTALVAKALALGLVHPPELGANSLLKNPQGPGRSPVHGLCRKTQGFP